MFVTCFCKVCMQGTATVYPWSSFVSLLVDSTGNLSRTEWYEAKAR